ncbi:PREDICTED: 5-formyltetrahydrofolate cyclo-ligase, mitochondrial-like [Fragaria vesca subsp. vesca]|uniref:5-formyltetrahydrofolate cyclo-ligase, mitochondrial-like n=1 Tax=Fragaria vesca subsp. vesca TaxID=101020 RepID=UPI0002C2F2A1|nr:PREDICTED: 5-formyltetrahydrofolate cyclo-ligase, mitochondrial-like [Fragaria vesca subsp. vesca]XP_011463410.1 PREDICTED: 5-formyltetrahydrofolate cyclo-ligase, mitochondrial-like [Fragaria vesca subsp. vesca]
MLRQHHRRATATELTKMAAHVAALITHPRTSPPSANERLSFQSHRSFATMTGNDESSLETIFRQKHSLRSRIRKELKNMDPTRKSEQDAEIQSIVLSAPWFKYSESICAYISSPELREVDTARIVSEILSKPGNGEDGDVVMRRKLYVPRVEDRNSNMRMLRIDSVDDLIVKSMNVLEPALSDAEGKLYEDAMEAKDPIDLFILPGLAFDRCGRRLGRSGGYYDTFLKKYQKLAKDRKWKDPLCVALSYSIQIVEEGVIPVTLNDVSVDALVSPAGFIPISPAAWNRCA